MLLLAGSPLGPSQRAQADTAEEAFGGEAFSVVLLPDKQFYTLRYPSTFLAQTRWIAANRYPLSIEAAIHLGDLTHRNTRREWRAADRALRVLENVLPYSVLPGNHDKSRSGEMDTSLFNRYFPPERFASRSWYGGHMGKTSDNNYIFFEAAGMEFMIVSLAYGTRREALEWANEVVAAHPAKRVIVAAHAYMDHDRTRLSRGEWGAVKNDYWTDGDEIWDAFIKRHPNIFLVVSGHIHGGGFLTSEGDHGNVVHQVLADFQELRSGGSGYLCLLTFLPERDLIQVRTYSPTLDQELRGEDHSFALPYEMPDRHFHPLLDVHAGHTD